MLTEDEIAQSLHASRVVSIAVPNPHGPLGLEQLAAAVSQFNPALKSGAPNIRRPITLHQRTWEKLDQLAEATAQQTSQPVSASQVASAIVERYVAALPQKDN